MIIWQSLRSESWSILNESLWSSARRSDVAMYRKSLSRLDILSMICASDWRDIGLDASWLCARTLLLLTIEIVKSFPVYPQSPLPQ
jgi:hypothetical protein